MSTVQKKPLQTLRMYLIKSSITSFKDILRKDAKVDEYPIKTGLGATGKFFLRRTQARRVEWFDFVQSGIQGTLPKLASVAHAAVLLLKIDNRIVALVFGTGRYLMRDTVYETDFRLRSTLNAIDPRTLDQVDVNWFGEMVVHKRIQVSQQSTLAAFEIDVTRERFRSITGKAKNASFGTRLHGSEGGFGIHARIDFSDLVAHCKECLKIYSSTQYQKAFPRHDDFAVLKDAAKLDELNGKLVSKLSAGTTTGIQISPPQIIDYGDLVGFSYSPKGELFSELLIDDYLKSGKDFSGLTLETLKSHRIFLRTKATEEPIEK